MEILLTLKNSYISFCLPNYIQIETCRKVENVLKHYDRKGLRLRVLAFHAALAQETRLANLKEFLNSHSEEVSLFLVSTDRYCSSFFFSFMISIRQRHLN